MYTVMPDNKGGTYTPALVIIIIHIRGKLLLHTQATLQQQTVLLPYQRLMKY